MPEPFIRLLIDIDQLHDYIEGMERHIMFKQMYKNHPFDITEYLTREMQWDFEYHLAALNADPSKYQPITIKKIDRSKCRNNYDQINTAEHVLITELMPYRLIHFLIENKAFEEYIKLFIWNFRICGEPFILLSNAKIKFNSEKAICLVINEEYFRCHSFKFNYYEWMKLSEKYKEYYFNSL